MEEYSSFFHQYQTNPLDYTLDGINFRSFSSDHQSYYQESTYNNRSDSQPEASQAGVERPAKQQKTCPSSSSTWILSFDKSNSISPATCHDQQVYGLENASCNINPNIEIEYSHVEEDKRVGSMTRNHLHAQEHVIAERKRREKLNQLFISLSTILPGLKKIDKASIIEDAIKHMKQLQNRVKTLEEQEAKMANIIVKKTHIFTDDESSSPNEIFDQDQYLPEIEARVWDRTAIIIRIHCEKKNKGCIASILKETENLHLSVVNSNVLPFGNSTLYITVVAQKNVESSMPMKDLVKNLRQALLKLII